MHRSDSSRQELPARATHPCEREQASFLTFPPSNPCRVSANAGSHHAVIRLCIRFGKQALCQFREECTTTIDVACFTAFPEVPCGDTRTATQNCSAGSEWSTPFFSHQCSSIAHFPGSLLDRPAPIETRRTSTSSCMSPHQQLWDSSVAEIPCLKHWTSTKNQRFTRFGSTVTFGIEWSN